MAKNEVKNPHDKTAKAVLSDINIAKKFFELHLSPSVKKSVDLKTLQLQKGSFVDKELREHLTDLLYSVKILGKPGYLYVLLEHQSSIDDLMAWRLLQYSVKIMAEHLKNSKRKKLPLVLPCVYYTGKPSKKKFVTNVIDCFESPLLAKRHFIKPFQLIDLNAFSDKTLMRDKTLAGLELLQKHIRTRDLSLLLDEMLEKGVFIQMYEQSGDYFFTMLKYIVDSGEIKKPDQFFNKLAEQFPGEKRLMTVAQYYKKQGIQQGIQEGVEKGKLETAKNIIAAGQSLEFAAKVTGIDKSKLGKHLH